MDFSGYKATHTPSLPPSLSPSLALVCYTINDLKVKEEVTSCLKHAICSMQYGNEDFLAGLAAEACSKDDR